MRNLLVCLMLCITSLAVAQKVSFKKGKVLFDKNPIANIEDKKGVYTISTLENEPVIIVEPTISNERVFYLKVNQPSQENKVLVGRTQNKTSMSKNQMIMDEFTFGTYKIFTAGGLDKEAVKGMLAMDDSELRALLEENRKAAAEAEAIMKGYLEGYASQRWDFNMEGEFNKDRGSSVPYGKVTRYKTDNGFNIVYDIYLYDNTKKQFFLYGKWNEKRDNVLVLNNGESYVLPAKYSSPDSGLNMDTLAKAMVYLAKK